MDLWVQLGPHISPAHTKVGHNPHLTSSIHSLLGGQGAQMKSLLNCLHPTQESNPRSLSCGVIMLTTAYRGVCMCVAHQLLGLL